MLGSNFDVEDEWEYGAGVTNHHNRNGSINDSQPTIRVA